MEADADIRRMYGMQRILKRIILKRGRTGKKRQGGETVEEIRRIKIKEATKEILNVYEKLDLNMTEIEIVSRSQNVAAKVEIAKKQLETEADKFIEEKQTPTKYKIIKWMPAICSTLAIILSVISLVLKLYR